MLKNYFKIAFRNIVRHKAFATINIAGLAIGMACSIFILLWVQHELSYDKFHKNAGTIYRLTAGGATNSGPMVPELKARIPAIKNFVRFSQPTPTVFETGTKKFEEKAVFYADSSLLQVFSFPLLNGNAETALIRPDAVLITEDMAKKYFGNEDPIGKILKRDNKDNVEVTGVLKNIPANSHLQFDFIMPLSAIAQTDWRLRRNIWASYDFYDYVQLDENFKATPAALAGLSRQVNKIFGEHVKENQPDMKLQALTDIHLRSDYQTNLPGQGNIQYVNIFFIVALFILAVACINFMNLATARSERRAKEVGLRKAVGAGRGQLIGQFLGESLFISFMAMLMAVGIVCLLLPVFNNLAGKELSIQLLDGKLIALLLGIALFTGLVSGSYPALFLSGFKPVEVLKGSMKMSGGNLYFRNGLVIMQFVVSIALLAGTAVVYKQLNYIKNRDIGFNKSNLLYMPMTGEMGDKQLALNAELKANPLTANFTAITDPISNLTSSTTGIEWEGMALQDKNIWFSKTWVTEGFFDVLQMKMVSGRALSATEFADSGNYVINEKAAKIMGMTPAAAIGKSLTFSGDKGTIVGVVKDFNYKPAQTAIEPMILAFNKWNGGIVLVRTQPGKAAATIQALEKISKQLNPAFPFSYGFVDQDINNLYKGEQQMGSLFNVFAMIAIFISCMGLYGLSAFMAEQRTKEIGVRKVLGASVFNVVYLLSTGFTKLILIAIVIAIPIAWFATNKWLGGFAYRVNVGWAIFLMASLAALTIAWITVSYESVKAAIVNPVKSLRSE
ncbi:putative ABC transport system permease protein [Chitinophaga sp. W3I9]|uniref:ABC transporter permease n=2 Tax=unclassified Chitinophaga TaxID=2619133 RepID=UPI003D24FE17